MGRNYQFFIKIDILVPLIAEETEAFCLSYLKTMKSFVKSLLKIRYSGTESAISRV